MASFDSSLHHHRAKEILLRKVHRGGHQKEWKSDQGDAAPYQACGFAQERGEGCLPMQELPHLCPHLLG